MNTALDYLPEYKRDELNRITAFTVDVMEPEMIILFGSYARNKWTEHKYVEDKWRRLEDTIRKLNITTPVSLIHHGIKNVNTEIRKNSYFFTDLLIS